jgi:thioredoxin-dependent peroxiredoxin
MKPNRTAKIGGNTVTLIGPELKVGDKAPEFAALDTSLQKQTLADYKGKIKLVSVVPSLDTGICDQQTRRFNEEAKKLDEKTIILTISMDLPFAQSRWCGAAGVDRVITLSDYLTAGFGIQYGVLIQELRLLNRSIFIIDAEDIIRYIQIVEDNGHPDYDAALKALAEIQG